MSRDEEYKEREWYKSDATCEMLIQQQHQQQMAHQQYSPSVSSQLNFDADRICAKCTLEQRPPRITDLQRLVEIYSRMIHAENSNTSSIAAAAIYKHSLVCNALTKVYSDNQSLAASYLQKGMLHTAEALNQTLQQHPQTRLTIELTHLIEVHIESLLLHAQLHTASAEQCFTNALDLLKWCQSQPPTLPEAQNDITAASFHFHLSILPPSTSIQEAYINVLLHRAKYYISQRRQKQQHQVMHDILKCIQQLEAECSILPPTSPSLRTKSLLLSHAYSLLASHHAHYRCYYSAFISFSRATSLARYYLGKENERVRRYQKLARKCLEKVAKWNYLMHKMEDMESIGTRSQDSSSASTSSSSLAPSDEEEEMSENESDISIDRDVEHSSGDDADEEEEGEREEEDEYISDDNRAFSRREHHAFAPYSYPLNPQHPSPHPLPTPHALEPAPLIFDRRYSMMTSAVHPLTPLSHPASATVPMTFDKPSLYVRIPSLPIPSSPLSGPQLISTPVPIPRMSSFLLQTPQQTSRQQSLLHLPPSQQQQTFSPSHQFQISPRLLRPSTVQQTYESSHHSNRTSPRPPFTTQQRGMMTHRASVLLADSILTAVNVAEEVRRKMMREKKEDCERERRASPSSSSLSNSSSDSSLEHSIRVAQHTAILSSLPANERDHAELIFLLSESTADETAQHEVQRRAEKSADEELKRKLEVGKRKHSHERPKVKRGLSVTESAFLGLSQDAMIDAPRHLLSPHHERSTVARHASTVLDAALAAVLVAERVHNFSASTPPAEVRQAQLRAIAEVLTPEEESRAEFALLLAQSNVEMQRTNRIREEQSKLQDEEWHRKLKEGRRSAAGSRSRKRRGEHVEQR